LHPELARNLGDARLQLHHAAQLVAAMGISYLPHADDDSHTNLGWIDGSASALASHVVNATPHIRWVQAPMLDALTRLLAAAKATSDDGRRWA
jgi:hypothetical protein